MNIVLATCIIELGNLALKILPVLVLCCYVAKYHRLSYLNQHPFMISHFCLSQVQVWFNWILCWRSPAQDSTWVGHLAGDSREASISSSFMLLAESTLLRVCLSQKLHSSPCPYFLLLWLLQSQQWEVKSFICFE